MTEPESTDRLALEPARIDWGADGVPRARGFDDLYYAASDGLAESRHVFLDQNDLPARFAALNAGDDFVIGETGFGTGLNFLAAWRLWRERAPAQATLHFLSVEGHPLASADLARALGGWDDLAEESKLLVDAYPTCLARGLHLLKFDQGRVRLVVAFDEAVRGLEAFLESGHPLHAAPRRGVDAWFLDGFAPARNPAMWRPELFELLRSVSAPGASFATFTAAGDVRRGLQDAGFTVEKAPGFGRKRDMLKGRLAAPAPRPGAEAFPASPYPDGHPHAWPVNADPVPAAPGARVAVVGGGLAGCHAASALAERGFTVTLLEAETTLATGGSGNAQGVLYARPSPAGGLAARFNLLALLFAQRHYRKFWNDASHRFGESCGVLHVAVNARDRERQAALAADLGDTALCHRLDAAAAAKQAGIPLGEGGLWFPSD